MTSISGYTIYETPCCGAKYERASYASISQRNYHEWSDGFRRASGYGPTLPVCKCLTCGEMFLTADGIKVDHRKYNDEQKKEMYEDIPYAPVMMNDQIVSAVWLSPVDRYPSEEIERLLRLAFWHQLNHTFRVIQPSSMDVHLMENPSANDWMKGRFDVDEEKDPNVRFKKSSMSALIPWEELDDAGLDKLIESNLQHLLPLLERDQPDSHMLIGDAYRALDQMDKAEEHYRHETGLENRVAEHLIELARDGYRRVIRVEPKDWVEPPQKPEPWINPNPSGDVVELQSRDYWYKIFGFLQQGWVLIEQVPEESSVMLYKIDDWSDIYDQKQFKNYASAVQYLLKEGYQRWDENPSAWSFLVPPGGPFCHKHSRIIHPKSRQR